MTLDEARSRIGDAVIYRRDPDHFEQGYITSVNDHYVFVRYGSNGGSQATYPSDLTFLAS